nr:hypothetical protein B0A51_11586 [Rachicladosporium sp. CCFEE 5018]
MSARADNADLRLTAKGHAAGVISSSRWRHFSDTKAQLDSLRELLESHSSGSQSWIAKGLPVRNDTHRRNAFDLLASSSITTSTLLPLIPALASYSPALLARMDIEGTYAPYITQQTSTAASMVRDEELKLPGDLDYESISGLSFEEKRALERVRPESVGMARRVEGVTPTGALRVAVYVKGIGRRREKERMVKETVEGMGIGEEGLAVA